MGVGALRVVAGAQAYTKQIKVSTAAACKTAEWERWFDLAVIFFMASYSPDLLVSLSDYNGFKALNSG
jgi:hypothetical protein